jgi:hypothetical protein
VFDEQVGDPAADVGDRIFRMRRNRLRDDAITTDLT